MLSFWYYPIGSRCSRIQCYPPFHSYCAEPQENGHQGDTFLAYFRPPLPHVSFGDTGTVARTPTKSTFDFVLYLNFHNMFQPKQGPLQVN